LATKAFLVNRFVRKIRLKIRFVETITILFGKIRLKYYKRQLQKKKIWWGGLDVFLIFTYNGKS
jgi:hypothetical protein